MVEMKVKADRDEGFPGYNYWLNSERSGSKELIVVILVIAPGLEQLRYVMT